MAALEATGEDMFFDDWDAIGRTVVVGGLTYPALILILRLTGKRALAKMNAFDFVVSVALGSTLATILLSSRVSLAAGLTALALLAGLQMAIAWLSVRMSAVRRLVKSEPSLLLHDGQLLSDALRHHRVTPGEVRQAVRARGIGELEQVHAVVLETDGSFSVISRSSAGNADVLADVR